MALRPLRHPDGFPADADLPLAGPSLNENFTPLHPEDTRASKENESTQSSKEISTAPGSPTYLAFLAMQAAVDQKGLDVRALDVSKCTNIADVFVIVSGTSDRHVESLSDKIRTALGQVNEQPQGSSGYESSHWVILDYGNLVVHIFYEPTRQHYHFDELWKNGVPLTPPAPLAQEMRMLRTGMYRL